MNNESSLEGAICLLPDADQDIEGTDRLSRRKFLKVGMGALASLALLEMGGAGFLFLRARSLEGEFGGLITYRFWRQGQSAAWRFGYSVL